MRSDSEIFLSEVLDKLNYAYLTVPRQARFVVEAIEASLVEVCERLALRGCAVGSERRDTEGHGVGPALDRIAAGFGSDLIVAGGYAHTRLRDWVVGGVTRELIAECGSYVLFSH